MAPAPVLVPSREPRRERAKARAPGLAPARDGRRLSQAQVTLEGDIALELVASGRPLPGGQRLARTEPRLNGSRRAADRVLEQARALSNGNRDGDLVSA
jgi:hypothetical protein